MSTLAPNGGWSWFHRPIAVYSSTYSAWFAGWTESDGAIGIAKIKSDGTLLLRTKQEGQTGQSNDDHDAPATLVLSSGKILQCWAHHTNQAVSRTSTNAGDIRTWNSFVYPTTPDTSDSYAQAYQVGDPSGTVYWFFRAGASAGTYNWWLRTSTNDGASWSNFGTALFGYGGGSGIGGRPYLQSYQTSPTRIELFITDNNSGATNNLYHCYVTINASTGARSWYNSDGTLIGDDATALPLTAAKLTAGSSQIETGTATWVWDAFNYSGNPSICYAKFTQTSVADDTHTYRRAQWNGSAWVTEDVTSGGTSIPNWIYSSETRYSGGICHDPNDSTSVYLSKCYGSGDFRVEKWTKSGTWAKAADVSGNTGNFNCRPFPAFGMSPTSVLWWQGTYVSWLSFTTTIQSTFGLSLPTTKPSSTSYDSVWIPAATNDYFLLKSNTDLTALSSGTARTLTVVGSPTWNASGTYGNEISGFGTSIYLKSDGSSPSLPADFTSATGSFPRWMAVLYKQSTKTADSYLCGFGNSANANNLFFLRLIATSGRPSFFGRDGTGSFDSAPSIAVDACDGNWHTMLAVESALSGTNCRYLYHDGGSAVGNSTDLSAGSTYNQFAIGVLHRSTDVNPCLGTIGAVLVGWGSAPNPRLIHNDLISGQFAGTRAAPPAAANGGVCILIGM